MACLTSVPGIARRCHSVPKACLLSFRVSDLSLTCCPPCPGGFSSALAGGCNSPVSDKEDSVVYGVGIDRVQTFNQEKDGSEFSVWGGWRRHSSRAPNRRLDVWTRPFFAQKESETFCCELCGTTSGAGCCRGPTDAQLGHVPAQRLF